MQSQIEIKFLTPKEMENAGSLDWRYEHVDKENLGFADPVKNRVYVRSGLDSELTKYLINHEVSHLFEMEGTDEDSNGIRHKKGGFLSFLENMFLPVGVGPAIRGETGAMRQGIANAATGFATALGTILGGPVVGGGIGNALGSATSNVAATGKPEWGQSVLSGLKTAGINEAGNLFGNSLLGQAFGTGANMAFGSSPSSTGTSKFGFNSMFPSGFSDNVTIPGNTLGQGFGLPGNTSPGGVGTGGQTGSLGLQGSNMGTGQAGITLGAQKGIDNVNTSGSQGGFSNFGSQQMGQQQPDPIGFNFGNGGAMGGF